MTPMSLPACDRSMDIARSPVARRQKLGEKNFFFQKENLLACHGVFVGGLDRLCFVDRVRYGVQGEEVPLRLHPSFCSRSDKVSASWVKKASVTRPSVIRAERTARIVFFHKEKSDTPMLAGEPHMFFSSVIIFVLFWR